MAPELMEQKTKERILQSAAQEFASRGFDGARVDDIARRAGVNKALIYYYYKSKEDLLEILFTTTVQDVFASKAMQNLATTDFHDPEAMYRLMNDFLETLEERQDVIRVALMELAKRTPITMTIFSLFEGIMEKMFSVPQAQGLEYVKDKPKAMITEFFTGILPMLDYVVYHEIWMTRFGIDEATLRRNFIESFIGTHFAYTLGDPGHGHAHEH